MRAPRQRLFAEQYALQLENRNHPVGLQRFVVEHCLRMMGASLHMRRGPVKSAAQFIQSKDGGEVGQCTTNASPVTAFGG